MSTYDFSTLITALPHNLISENLTEFIEQFLTERANFIGFDKEATFLDLHLSISNDIVSTKIYDFEIVNFPFLDGDVPRSTSYGVYISQLIHFARTSSYVTDFNSK